MLGIWQDGLPVRSIACVSVLRASAAWVRPLRRGSWRWDTTVTVWNRSPDKIKPLADAGAKAAESPAELAGAGRGDRHHSHQPGGSGRRLRGVRRPARGRREGQARHRDEHGAAARGGGAGREGAGEGRHLRRVPGRRNGRSGAPGQAARLRGRRQGGLREGQAAARPDVPARRAHGARGCRRQHEARDQPAAAGVLSGSGRSLRAVPAPEARQHVADGVPVRHVGRPQRAQEPRAVHRQAARRQGPRRRQLRHRPDPQGSRRP